MYQSCIPIGSPLPQIYCNAPNKKNHWLIRCTTKRWFDKKNYIENTSGLHNKNCGMWFVFETWYSILFLLQSVLETCSTIFVSLKPPDPNSELHLGNNSPNRRGAQIQIDKAIKFPGTFGWYPAQWRDRFRYWVTLNQWKQISHSPLWTFSRLGTHNKLCQLEKFFSPIVIKLFQWSRYLGHHS